MICLCDVFYLLYVYSVRVIAGIIRENIPNEELPVQIKLPGAP